MNTAKIERHSGTSSAIAKPKIAATHHWTIQRPSNVSDADIMKKAPISKCRSKTCGLRRTNARSSSTYEKLALTEIAMVLRTERKMHSSAIDVSTFEKTILKLSELNWR